jgi:hypothetical protein
MDKKKVNVEPRNVVREGQGTIGEGTRGSEKEQWERRTRNWKRKGQRTILGRDEEQWEWTQWRTWSSVREGYGTVGASST